MAIDPLILLIIVLTVPIIPTFWAIMEIPRRRFASRKKKIIWFVVVSSLPFFGAMFYFLFARRHTEPIENQ